MVHQHAQYIKIQKGLASKEIHLQVATVSGGIDQKLQRLSAHLGSHQPG